MPRRPATPPATIKISRRLPLGRSAVLLLFGPVFLVTACGTPDGARPSSTPPDVPVAVTTKQAATSVVVAPLADSAKPLPSAPDKPQGATTVATAPDVTPKKDTTTRPPPSPARLLGMRGAAVAGLLGPAKLVRRDGDAEIWQYRNDHCVLDVFLYGPGPLSVTHVDLRKRRRGTQDKTACYAELASRANAGS